MALVIDPQIESQLQWVIEDIKANRPVALPTETVYGLAGRVFSEIALGNIFFLKARPTFDPLIAHVSDFEMALSVCERITEMEAELMKRFWPGPLTILCLKSKRVPDLCTASSEWVAVRSPAHPVFRRILSVVGEPLAAPSANRFQGISPTSYRHVLSELGPHGLGLVVDGGDCQHGVESTVVRVNDAEMKIEILRPGACPREEIETFVSSLGYTVVASESVLDAREQQHSPGRLAKHYSPSKPVLYVNREWTEGVFDFDLLKNDDCVLFVTAEDFEMAKRLGFKNQSAVNVLGHDSVEAAARLFKSLRDFDGDTNSKRLVAFASDFRGLGAAICDRLSRAGGSERS